MPDEEQPGQASGEARPIHDPRVLRAIAHPLRNRILGELEAAGSVRAADIAKELGIPANQASFHLRQLAKYGLVEEAPEEARDRRDRVWRRTGDRRLNVNLKEMEEAPGGAAAVTVWRKSATSWAHQIIESAYSSEREPDTLRTIIETSVKVTKQEAEQLCEELDEVLQRWSERTLDDAADRRTYLFFSAFQPYPGDRAGE
ncbi:MAG TPA: helix-turn-helix domain-containing protein [Nocardioides sp.]|jgi:predicted ArsR family transcriptional regulator